MTSSAPNNLSTSGVAGLDWFESRLGRAYQLAERQVVSAIVSNIFGYHALQISARAPTIDLIGGSQVISCHHLHLDSAERQLLGGALVATTAALPFSEQSFQLVVSQHTHHWCQWPTLLAEIERVLAPDGVLLLCAVRSAQIRRRLPPMSNSWRPNVHNQQLRKLGLTTLLTRPIFGQSRVQQLLAELDRLNMLPGGWLARAAHGYVLVARKDSATIPILRLRKQQFLSRKLGSTAISQFWSRRVIARRCSRD